MPWSSTSSALGHRRIAVLTGRRTVSTSIDRVAGARRALEEAGLSLPDELVFCGGFNSARPTRPMATGWRSKMLDAPGRSPDGRLLRQQLHRVRRHPRAPRGRPAACPTTSRSSPSTTCPTEWVSRPVPDRRRPARLRDRQPRRDAPPGPHHGRPRAAGESVILPFELIIRRSSGPLAPSSPPASSSAPPVQPRDRPGTRRRRPPGGHRRPQPPPEGDVACSRPACSIPRSSRRSARPGTARQVLIADGNYPLATRSNPAAYRVFLNLEPGQAHGHRRPRRSSPTRSRSRRPT